jgi:hypothetical protein
MEHRHFRQEEVVLLVVRLLQLHESLVRVLVERMEHQFCHEGSCIMDIRHKNTKKTFFYGNF